MLYPHIIVLVLLSSLPMVVIATSSHLYLSSTFVDEPLPPPSPPPSDTLVMFYAPWCPHCKHYVSKYNQIAEAISNAASYKSYREGGGEGGEVGVMAVSCTEYGEYCGEQDVHSFPTIKYYGGEARGWKVIKDRNVDKVLETVKKLKTATTNIDEGKSDSIASRASNSRDDGDPIASVLPPPPLSKTNLSPNRNPPTSRTSPSAGSDACKSLLFTLLQSVSEPTNELLSFLTLINEYTDERVLPCYGKVKAVTKGIREEGYLEGKSKGGKHGFSVLVKEAFGQPLDLDLSKVFQWSNECSHGREGEGYTCGLWAVLHIISVGVGRGEKGRTSGEVVRGFIDKHMWCEECRGNFLRDYDDCMYGVCDLRDGEKDGGRMLTWLWRVHNGVGERVGGEGWSLWPSRKECQGCWDEHMGEHEDEVIKYVAWYYTVRRGGERIVMTGSVEGNNFMMIGVILGVFFIAVMMRNKKGSRGGVWADRNKYRTR